MTILSILALWCLAGLFSSRLRKAPGRAWARFWRTVALVVYLHKPWHVARDRARRELP